MNLHYTLSLNDMLAFRAYCLRHVSQVKNGVFSARVGFPLIAVAISLLISISSPNFLVIAVYIIVIAVLIGIFYPVISKRLFVRSFRTMYHNGITEELSFSVNEEGISSSSNKGKTEFFWSTIRDIAVTRSIVLFFYTPNCALIVPRNVFADNHSYDQFIHYIQHYHTRPIIQVSQ